MNSIRLRLFLILLVTTGIVWVCAIAWIYFKTCDEVHRVLDARLIGAARMVSSLITSQNIDPVHAAQMPVDIAGRSPYDRQLFCQIWALDGRMLVGRSDAAPLTPLSDDDTEGFFQTVVDGETWRVYAVKNDDLGMRVLVGDNLHIRDHLVADVIRGLALPALLILPILAGLIWLSVRKGLAPLNAVAGMLEKRLASDLSPLPDMKTSLEIRPVIRSLNGLFSRVNAAREHERDFTAFAAHELRTPIAGLKTQAQIALGSKDPAIQRNALDQIMVGVDRTSRLVRQLTDLTRVESGTLDNGQQIVHIGEALRVLANDLSQYHVQAKEIRIPSDMQGLVLTVAPSLFAFAARNLLENACLHSPLGSPVCCRFRQSDTYSAIVIDDYGTGIAEDELPKVRDRFFRGRNKTPMGSGLGLAIADLALARMGGELHLENRADGGLRAELRFARRYFI